MSDAKIYVDGDRRAILHVGTVATDYSTLRDAVKAWHNLRPELALLWQIYSRRFSLPIHFRQCGHRFCGSRAMRVTMAWRTDGKLG